MKSAGVGADAAASVPTTSMPIQAGEPRNISIANTSWKRLTSRRPGRTRNGQYCSVALAPALVAAEKFDQRRRVLLPAEVLLGQHAHVVAGAPHQRRLDLVVAQHMAAEHAAARQLRDVAMRDERRDADDGVVAPVGAAIALPPGRADGPGAHAEPHAELEEARERAGRGQADDEALQNAELRIGLHDAHQAQDRRRGHEAVGVERDGEFVLAAPALAEVPEVAGLEAGVVGAAAIGHRDAAAPLLLGERANASSSSAATSRRLVSLST